MWRNVVAFFDDRRLWIISTVVYYVFWWSPSWNHFYGVIMFSAGGQPWLCHLPVRLRVAGSADPGRKKVFVITNVLVEEHGFPHLLEENLSKKYIPLWLLYYYLRALVSPLRGKYIIEPCHEIFHPGCFLLLQNSWVPSWTISVAEPELEPVEPKLFWGTGAGTGAIISYFGFGPAVTEPK